MKNKIKYILAGFLLVMTSSCTDWLNPKPINNMVLDDYWKKQSDVESVVRACYRAMAEPGFMERIILGGELRSDNVIIDMDRLHSTQEQADINDMTIKPTNGLLPWKDFYNVINLCNTVLEYAPQVTKLDPDYSSGFLRAHEAEVRTLRALAYFYLVRIYRDVPYIDFAYSEDTQPFNVPKMDGDSILNRQVEELLIAEKYALKSWGYGTSTQREQNKGRVTKNMVRALLADIYLWLGKYDECIDACNRIIPDILSEKDVLNPDLATGAELRLLSNETLITNSFLQLFYSGNSMESIFELQFSTQAPNPKVKDFFGDDQNVGKLAASKVVADIFKEQANLKDLRGKTSFTQDNLSTGNKKGFFQIFKYIGSDYSESATSGGSWRIIPMDPFVRNWIFYRVPDVYLMKAEALVERNQGSDLSDAMDLVNLTYMRSNPGGVRLYASDYPDKDKMRDLVLLERQREFLFEGKRWFDLVRLARREDKETGNHSKMLDLVAKKYDFNGEVVKSKMRDPYALYLPIAEKELIANQVLEQNPYYKSEFTTTKNK